MSLYQIKNQLSETAIFKILSKAFTLMILFTLFSFSLYSTSKEEKILYGYFDNEGTRPIKMFLVGETVSIEKASTIEIDLKKDNSQLEYDTRPDTVSVKILHNPGVRVGQTLYLLEKHPDHDFYKDGNIVGEIKVLSIYKTTFYGEQLRGEGHLKQVENKNMIMAVGMPTNARDLHEAVVAKKQGDYYQAKDDLASAIQYYKKAIKQDGDAPEPHAALARLHEKKGEGLLNAAYEYKIAWKNRDKFLDKHDELTFLINYASFLITKYKTESRDSKPNLSDLDLSIQSARESFRISPKNYNAIIAILESNFLKYLALTSKEKNPELRKNQDILEGALEDLFKEALNQKSEDYKLHTLGTYFYLEKWNRLGGESTQAEVSELSHIKERIEFHSKKYLVYRPKNSKPDRIILQALEKVKSER
ncbi:MAG: hypothetical protein SFU98_19365 [Leptospiraceae bacterium]|nr:hypothetical protein [Leptospiraceae bacterium]